MVLQRLCHYILQKIHTSILPNLTANMKAGLFPTMVFIAGIGGQLVGARIRKTFL